MRRNYARLLRRGRAVVFYVFLVAAATEAVLEVFRGALERVGITWLKGTTSLDDIVKMATVYLKPGTEYQGRIVALWDLVGDLHVFGKRSRMT